jgi:hypothetical protein
LNRQRFATAYRAGLGLLTLAALVVQYLTSRAHPAFNAVNFFSYFTNLSNFFGAIVFLCVGLGARRTLAVELARGAATLYLVVTFLVFAVLLSDIPLGILLPWVNTVLHQIMPIAVLLDWVFSPPEHRLDLRRSLLWLAFPIVYVVYVLIRGAETGWYPYPFLDPSKVSGYGGVTAYCVGITILFLMFTALLTWFGNYLRERRMAVRGRVTRQGDL